MTLLQKISAHAQKQMRAIHKAIHIPINDHVDGEVHNYVGIKISDTINGLYELEVELKHNIIVKTGRYDFTN